MAETRSLAPVLLTGLPGSGKSLVGSLLRDSGYAVIDADHSSLQTWGSEKSLKQNASFFWMWTHPPRWQESELPKLRSDGAPTVLAGWYPGILPTLKHFDKVFYLSPRWDLRLLVNRMRQRQEKTFGSTEPQIATALIATVATEAAMRMIAFFNKKLIILDATKSPPELASVIAKELRK